MTKLNFSFLLFFFSLVFSAQAQMESYDYKRPLKGILEEWHSIVIPTEMYADLNQNLTDLRIYGVSKNGDTIEVPYLLSKNTDQTIVSKVSFKVINQSSNENGYYFTFEATSESAVNQLKLDFEQDNFDWRVNLEASQNQLEWFSIVEDYRILSIKNSSTDYRFTDLKIPTSKYKYFRLLVKSKAQPDLKSVYFTRQETIAGQYRKYDVKSISNIIDDNAQQTTVDVQFHQPIRAGQLEVFINENFDYYRDFNISYLKDSLKTERGWKKNYVALGQFTLSSIEQTPFTFKTTTFKDLRIKINNGNNKALEIDSVSVKGPVYTLQARFLDEAEYSLVYGKTSDYKPTYDIAQFKNNIPKDLKSLSLGEEIIIENNTQENSSSGLFENTYWLYGIMLVIILVLGWFSIKMIKTSKEES